MGYDHPEPTDYPESEDSASEDEPENEKRSNPWAEAASSAWKSFHADFQSEFDEGKGTVVSINTLS